MAVKSEAVKKSKTVKTAAEKKSKIIKKSINDHKPEIMEKAYNLYLKRINKGISGNEINDWLTAENEVRKIHKL